MKVRRTGGAQFDPDAPFLHFIALSGLEGSAVQNLLMAIDRDNDLTPLVERRKTILVDSGVFGLANRHALRHGIGLAEALALPPEQIDGHDWLVQTYIETVQRYEQDVWGYIEIDQGGQDVKRETRRYLEREGLRPIPVYHPAFDSWDYFDELASEYDRIAIGNLVALSHADRKRVLVTAWERRRLYPRLRWMHLLGYTPNQYTNAYPFESTDASSWGYAIRFGAPSGSVAYAMQQAYSKFDDRFSGVLAGDDGEQTSYPHLIEYTGMTAMLFEQGWRASWQGLQDAIGPLPVVPKRVHGEPVPERGV